MIKFVRFSNAAMAIVMMCVLLGAYYQQFFKHELPCPLCILQRLAMIAVAIGNLLNLKFGIRAQHYGLSLFGALFGATVSLRQIALHVCPGMPIFGIPVWGYNLFSWAFFVFAASILALVIFLLLYPLSKGEEKPKMNLFDKLIFCFVFLVVLANFLTTFSECGLGYCKDVPWPQPSEGLSNNLTTPRK